MIQKSKFSAIQYTELTPDHEHYEIAVTSFVGNKSASFKAELNSEEAKKTKEFIIRLQSPEKEVAGKAEVEGSNDGIYRDGCYLLAEDICSCGDHNPLPLKVVRGSIFFIGIGQSICGNEDNKENRQILSEAFKSIEVASEDEIIVALLKSAEGRTAQAREFRDQAREMSVEISAYKDAIAAKFLAEK